VARTWPRLNKFLIETECTLEPIQSCVRRRYRDLLRFGSWNCDIVGRNKNVSQATTSVTCKILILCRRIRPTFPEALEYGDPEALDLGDPAFGILSNPSFPRNSNNDFHTEPRTAATRGHSTRDDYPGPTLTNAPQGHGHISTASNETHSSSKTGVSAAPHSTLPSSIGSPGNRHNPSGLHQRQTSSQNSQIVAHSSDPLALQNSYSLSLLVPVSRASSSGSSIYDKPLPLTPEPEPPSSDYPALNRLPPRPQSSFLTPNDVPIFSPPFLPLAHSSPTPAPYSSHDINTQNQNIPSHKSSNYIDSTNKGAHYSRASPRRKPLPSQRDRLRETADTVDLPLPPTAVIRKDTDQQTIPKRIFGDGGVNSGLSNSSTDTSRRRPSKKKLRQDGRSDTVLPEIDSDPQTTTSSSPAPSSLEEGQERSRWHNLMFWRRGSS
jgi:hypothetical protein